MYPIKQICNSMLLLQIKQLIIHKHVFVRRKRILLIKFDSTYIDSTIIKPVILIHTAFTKF